MEPHNKNLAQRLDMCHLLTKLTFIANFFDYTLLFQRCQGLLLAVVILDGSNLVSSEGILIRREGELEFVEGVDHRHGAI